VPELCIEIASTNRAYDRVKRFLYAEAGVQEYWLIDPAGFVECWKGPRLTERSELTETLRSTLLPGFELAFSKLFDPRRSIIG
jgi:Uma2 family endonuclease